MQTIKYLTSQSESKYILQSQQQQQLQEQEFLYDEPSSIYEEDCLDSLEFSSNLFKFT